jgi:gas vesicle protein
MPAPDQVKIKDFIRQIEESEKNITSDMIEYDESTPGNWTSDPADIAEALDEVGGRISATVSQLNQTVSSPPTQSEVQAISDTVDSLISELQNAGLMS